MRVDRALTVLCVLLTGAGCASAPAPRPSPAPAQGEPHVVEGPARITTAGGATARVPAGYSAIRRGPVVQLSGPEGDQDAQVYLVELEADSGAAAVPAAWKLVDERLSHKVHNETAVPSTEGYDEVYLVSYVPDGAGVRAQAVVRREGRRCWVTLVRGSAPVLDRRGAQIRVFLASLEVPGVREEDLSGARLRSLKGATGELRAFIEAAMKATGTPGLAIAVVEGGEVVYAEGFGVRELGQAKEVTPDTLMMIGSVSKSMTTLMMATLVDDGKLSWTAPVRSVYPRFTLGDAELAARLQVQHLVCACAGLPRKDLPLMLEFGNKKPGDVFGELSTLEPSTGLGETFQYQNHMVAAGGYVAGHALHGEAPVGEAYDRAMAARVFAPLGMKRTTLRQAAALADADHATPHSMDLQGKHHVVPISHERFASYIRPSGGIWSSAREMARYLIAELRGGIGPDGERVVSEQNLLRRRKPIVKISADQAYGLGWVIAEHKGLARVVHGGGTMGFATLLSFYPERGVGAILIANGVGGHIVEGRVWNRLTELWFGTDEKARQRLDHTMAQLEQERAKLARRTRVPAAEWIQPLLGVHHNDELGRFELRPLAGGRAGAVELDAGEYSTPVLQHDRPDGKRVLLFTRPPLAGLELEPTSGGTSFRIKRAQETYVFTRTARDESR